MYLFKQFLKQLGIYLIFLNLIIVPAVFFFSFKNQCIQVGIPESDMLKEPCGALSNPFLNILWLNIIIVVIMFIKFAFYKPPEQDN